MAGVKNILICPDKFKDSMTATEAANAIEAGFRSVLPEADYRILPLADGGEGSLEVFKSTGKFSSILSPSSDPLFRRIEAEWLYDAVSKKAIVELSKASGLELLSIEDRNPMHTTSLGFGQSVRAALNNGATNILLCIGGSATNDCGMGLASALGYQFLDKNNQPLKPIGSNLIHVQDINASNLHPLLHKAKYTVACDVDNVLFGNHGAAQTYAKQKGANQQEIDQLDRGLQHFSKIVKKCLGKDVAHIPGSGAAGGMGAGLLTFLNATLESGAEMVLKAIGFQGEIRNRDLVVTGEGRVDASSFNGKLLSAINRECKKIGVPVVSFCGSMEDVSSSEDCKLIAITLG